MTSYRIEQLVGRLLDQAEAAVNAGDWPTVAARCESILLLEPDEPDATHLLLAARRRTGSHPQDVELVLAANEQGRVQARRHNVVAGLVGCALIAAGLFWAGSCARDRDFGGAHKDGAIGQTVSVGSLDLLVTAAEGYDDGVLIQVKARNSRGGDYSFSASAFELIDADGVRHQAASYAVRRPGQFGDVSLIRGGVFEGTLYFSRAGRPVELKYEPTSSFNTATIALTPAAAGAAKSVAPSTSKSALSGSDGTQTIRFAGGVRMEPLPTPSGPRSSVSGPRLGDTIAEGEWGYTVNSVTTRPSSTGGTFTVLVDFTITRTGNGARKVGPIKQFVLHSGSARWMPQSYGGKGSGPIDPDRSIPDHQQVNGYLEFAVPATSPGLWLEAPSDGRFWLGSLSAGHLVVDALLDATHTVFFRGLLPDDGEWTMR